MYFGIEQFFLPCGLWLIRTLLRLKREDKNIMKTNATNKMAEGMTSWSSKIKRN